jgi:hypothetical protein
MNAIKFIYYFFMYFTLTIAYLLRKFNHTKRQRENAMKPNKIPQWQPTKEQREFLDKKASEYGTITGYIKGLVNREMKKDR